MLQIASSTIFTNNVTSNCNYKAQELMIIQEEFVETLLTE